MVFSGIFIVIFLLVVVPSKDFTCLFLITKKVEYLLRYWLWTTFFFFFQRVLWYIFAIFLLCPISSWLMAVLRTCCVKLPFQGALFVSRSHEDQLWFLLLLVISHCIVFFIQCQKYFPILTTRVISFVSFFKLCQPLQHYVEIHSESLFSDVCSNW